MLHQATPWMGIYDDEIAKIEQKRRNNEVDTDDEWELRDLEKEESFRLYSQTPFLRDSMNHDSVPLLKNYLDYNNKHRIKYDDVSQILQPQKIQSRIQTVMNLKKNKQKTKFFKVLPQKLKSKINTSHSFYMQYKNQSNGKKRVYNPVFFLNQIDEFKFKSILTKLQPVGSNEWTLSVWEEIFRLNEEVFIAQQYYIIARSMQATKWSTWHFGYKNVTQIPPQTILGELNTRNKTKKSDYVKAINEIVCQYVPPILKKKFAKPWQQAWYLRRIVCYICGAIVPTKNYWKQWDLYWNHGKLNTSLIWCWICAQVAHACHLKTHLRPYHCDEWCDDEEERKQQSFRCCPCRYLHSMIDIVPSECAMDFSPIPKPLIKRLCIIFSSFY